MIKSILSGRILLITGLFFFLFSLQEASAQESQQLTQAEFNAELRSALEHNDDSHIEELIKNYRLYVKPFVDALIQESIRLELKGRLEESEDLNRMAAKTAEVHNRIFNEKSLVIAVNYLTKWSKEQKGKKLIGDSLYADGTKLRGNEPDRAIEIYQKAIETYRDIGDERGEAEVLGGIGLSYWNIDPQRCLEFYEEALEMREKVDDKQLLGNTLNSLGSVYYTFFNDYIEAINWYNKAEKLRQEIGDINNLQRTRLFKAAAYMALGDVYNVNGQYSESLEQLETARQIYSDLNDPAGAADALSQTGFVYSKLGEYKIAVEKLSEAENLMRVENDSLGLAGIFNHFGIVLQKAGRSERAEQYYLSALKYYEKRNDIGRELPILSNLGALSFDNKTYIKAEDYLKRGLAKCRELDDKLFELDFLINLANSQTMLGKLDEAKANYETGLLIEKEINNPDLRWKLKCGLAENYERRGEIGKAVELNDTALLIIETIRNSLEDKDLKASYLASERYVFEDIIDFLAKQHIKDGSKGYDHLAFSYAERSKSRVLLDLLMESANQSRKVENNWLNNIDPVSLEEAKSLCPDKNSIILNYSVGDSSSCLWAITKSDYELVVIPERRTLQEKIEALRFSIQDPESETSDFFNEASSFLYDNLIKPVEHMLSKKSRLIIIPDGILNYLPFEVLLEDRRTNQTQHNYSEFPYLVSKYPISYAQSVSVLKNLLAEGDEIKSNRSDAKKLIAFGDPVYESNPDKENPGFKRLVYSGEEIENIAALFPEGSSAIYLRDRATEGNVKKDGALTKYNYIHFATHGYIDENQPDLSSLVLTQDSDSGEDGYLRSSEIFDLKIKPDLVVLSACQSGLGKLIRGEGLVGLTRAFMYAGAPAIIVSLWSVSDKSTSILVEEFYKYLIENKSSKMDALRKAQLSFIGNPQYSNPFYWAPFILIGDWR